MNPSAPNLCISRIVSCTSNSGPLVTCCCAVSSLLESLLALLLMPLRCCSRLRDVDPPTVVKSGNAEGHTTTCTSFRLRFTPPAAALVVVDDDDDVEYT